MRNVFYGIFTTWLLYFQVNEGVEIGWFGGVKLANLSGANQCHPRGDLNSGCWLSTASQHTKAMAGESA